MNTTVTVFDKMFPSTIESSAIPFIIFIIVMISLFFVFCCIRVIIALYRKCKDDYCIEIKIMPT